MSKNESTGLTAITVRIPVETNNRLDKLASSTFRAKSYYIREALNTSIDDMEKTYLQQRKDEEAK